MLGNVVTGDTGDTGDTGSVVAGTIVSGPVVAGSVETGSVGAGAVDAGAVITGTGGTCTAGDAAVGRPSAISPTTTTVSSVAGSTPSTVHVYTSAALVHDGPFSTVARYVLIGSPPSSAGGDHDTTIDDPDLAAATCSGRYEPGGVATTATDGGEGEVFDATTLIEYCVPSTSPVIVHDTAGPKAEHVRPGAAVAT